MPLTDVSRLKFSSMEEQPRQTLQDLPAGGTNAQFLDIRHPRLAQARNLAPGDWQRAK